MRASISLRLVGPSVPSQKRKSDGHIFLLARTCFFFIPIFSMVLTANKELNGDFGASLGIEIFTVVFGVFPVLVHGCLERNPLALKKRTITITADSTKRRTIEQHMAWRSVAWLPSSTITAPTTTTATTTNAKTKNNHNNNKRHNKKQSQQQKRIFESLLNGRCSSCD